ncbi:alpha,alpha-trehalase TreF [Lacibacter sp.]|uniref:alpha,alpha-trehalase TreF n=1 Tax=Lacibacter sp. TaxID=1915409 RepID=UPI002B4AEFE4|nr:alpha,alpha-trehalase TreF [Lacibacter sp.]HLP37950.1 alpha,alpha-trehalase TreF [Lacibacter sp.]
MKQKEIFELSPLFEDVQMQQVFEDGKTFVDCIPKQSVELILAEYQQGKSQPGFDLRSFVTTHFELPHVFASDYHTDALQDVKEHIHSLWKVLTRKPDAEQKGSLIPLPNPYIVPGGRFGEVYYWDSYFTMLGLKESGMYEMIGNMVNNFTHLIHTIGFIPNGNRTYYLGRSQPPFYALMVELMMEIKGEAVLANYLPALEKEYQFWMMGADSISAEHRFEKHLVLMEEGELLNRYCDAYHTARPESYREDVELMHAAKQPTEALYAHLRAGAESGWDYSCRWFKSEDDFATIHTIEIVPVDLNCLLFHLEETIAKAYKLKDDDKTAQKYLDLAAQRKQAIHHYCWNESQQFFTDYDSVSHSKKQIKTLAGVAPLFFKMATQEHADAVAATLESEFLKDGGLTTTLKTTGQQWDAPNGWAPLQWMSVIGLENYGHTELAAAVAKRWIQLNTDVYQRTGKLMEKYNVVDTHLEAGGGEYAGQDGFGWTNGVLLALMKKYE